MPHHQIKIFIVIEVNKIWKLQRCIRDILEMLGDNFEYRPTWGADIFEMPGAVSFTLNPIAD
jgi:hypothetical protein